MTEPEKKPEGERMPPACPSCRRLEALVDKVMSCAIEAIASLHHRPPSGTTPEQEAAIVEAAGILLVGHLRKKGLFPGPKPLNGQSEIIKP